MKQRRERPQVCGVVLLRDDGAALLQWRDDKLGIADPGLWVFPGGHSDPNESPEACAAREFHEETGYSCGKLHHLVSYSANELGYAGDFELHFYWDRFDGVQEYRCLEGQGLRFVGREAADDLAAPGYLYRVWDMASFASGKEVFT